MLLILQKVLCQTYQKRLFLLLVLYQTYLCYFLDTLASSSTIIFSLRLSKVSPNSSSILIFTALKFSMDRKSKYRLKKNYFLNCLRHFMKSTTLLKMAWKHYNCLTEQWHRVAFSNEIKFHIFHVNGYIRVLYKPYKAAD